MSTWSLSNIESLLLCFPSTLNLVVALSTSKNWTLSTFCKATSTQWDSFPRPAPNSTKHLPGPSKCNFSMLPKIEACCFRCLKADSPFFGSFKASCKAWWDSICSLRWSSRPLLAFFNLIIKSCSSSIEREDRGTCFSGISATSFKPALISWTK